MLRLVSNSGLLLGEFDFFSEDEIVQLEQGDNSIFDFLSIFSLTSSILPQPYQKAAHSIGLSYKDSLKTVPIHRLKSSLLEVKKGIEKTLSDADNLIYFKNYLKMRRFLDSMQRPTIDLERLEDLISKQKYDGVKSNLKSFLTDDPTKYSMSNTATGRLSVTSGAKILTAPSEAKATLKSRYTNGKVLQIDLTSAEPNFALFYAGGEPMSDLYEFCADSVLSGRVDRDTAKLVLLSSIYGQSEKNLKQNLPAGVSASQVVKHVKRFLSIDETKQKLMSSWGEGNFRNYLCRPLKSSEQRLVISHFLQSSVAECALLMFAEFCEKNDVAPIFVIHDALVIDCEESVADRIMSKDFSFIFQGVKFPASVTQIT